MSEGAICLAIFPRFQCYEAALSVSELRVSVICRGGEVSRAVTTSTSTKHRRMLKGSICLVIFPRFQCSEAAWGVSELQVRVICRGGEVSRAVTKSTSTKHRRMTADREQKCG